jgi:hypothetical protein
LKLKIAGKVLKLPAITGSRLSPAAGGYFEPWAVQNNFVGMVTCFWVWPQFVVVVELWCSIH